jgi:hypothetical protein
VCGNANDQISGQWTDDGENIVAQHCEGDTDGDGFLDSEDNCYLYNPDQADCNGNEVGDVCDITDGTSTDWDGNEIPDECECLADFTDDNAVNINDLLVVIATWGTSGPLGDSNYDGIVNIEDLLVVISGWGDCP